MMPGSRSAAWAGGIRPGHGWFPCAALILAAGLILPTVAAGQTGAELSPAPVTRAELSPAPVTRAAAAGPPSATEWQGLQDPRERFALANRYYQEGHFLAAAAVYHSVFAAGHVSSALLLNLGNAWLRGGELGEAIVAYRRGLRLTPRDRDLQANLAYAQSLTLDAVPATSTSIFLDRLAGLVRRISAGEALRTAVCLYWLSVFLFVASRLVPATRRLATSILWGLLPALVLAGGLAAERTHAVWGGEIAVVLDQVLEVRNGPGEDYVARFSLHEGTAVPVRRATDEWLEIELTDELNGWVPLAAVERI